VYRVGNKIGYNYVCRGTMNCALAILLPNFSCGHDASCTLYTFTFYLLFGCNHVIINQKEVDMQVVKNLLRITKILTDCEILPALNFKFRINPTPIITEKRTLKTCI